MPKNSLNELNQFHGFFFYFLFSERKIFMGNVQKKIREIDLLFDFTSFFLQWRDNYFSRSDLRVCAFDRPNSIHHSQPSKVSFQCWYSTKKARATSKTKVYNVIDVILLHLAHIWGAFFVLFVLILVCE